MKAMSLIPVVHGAAHETGAWPFLRKGEKFFALGRLLRHRASTAARTNKDES
jgi:hypothetical protein